MAQFGRIEAQRKKSVYHLNSLKRMFAKYRYHLLALLAGLSFSSLSVFSALLTQQHIDAFSQVFWRLFFGSIFALVLAELIFKQNLRLDRNEFNHILVNTLLYLGGSTTFTGAIYLGTPIAKAVALNYSYPITVVILTFLLFKDLPSKRKLMATVLSLISVAVLLEVWQIKGLAQIKSGELLALANSLFYGAIIVWGTKIRKDTKLNPFTSLFYTLLFALPGLFVLSFVLNSIDVGLYTPVFRFDLARESWLALMGIGSLGLVVPLALIYFAASKLKPYVTSVLLLTEPVFVYIFGLILFGQQLSFGAVVGAVGVLASVLLAASST